MTTSLNPYEMIGNIRTLFWNSWMDKKLVEFLLIDFNNAPLVKRGAGNYMIYYVIAEADITYLGVDKGDKLLLSISFQAFLNAINMLCNEYRVPSQKKFSEGKNLYIKLEKVNKYQIKIHKQEVREPTEEQLMEADRQYKILRTEDEIRKKRYKVR